MIVLGVSCYFHDSAACIIKDGEIIAAAAEERFSRIKHDKSFPKLAIEYCLDSLNIAANEIDFIAFYEKPLVKFERVISQHLQNFPKSLPQFVENMSSWVNEKIDMRKVFRKELNYFGEVLFVDHHTSHAASAYYLSGYKKSAIVTIDGVGEWSTTTIGFGKGNKIKIEKEINFPNSLGLLYSTLTTYLGFSANNSEYKVMGLAAYGNAKRFENHFDKLITVFEDGSYELNMEYFDFDWANHMPSKKMISLFGHPIRKRDAKVYKYHEDIAAALQKKIEDVIFNLLKEVYKLYGTDNLCLAGGVALNSVMNGKLLKRTPFKSFFIPPDPSDAGAAMGAALYVNNSFSKNRVESKKFHPYLGPSYPWHKIKKELDNYGLKYHLFTNRKKLIEEVADLLNKRKVIGWFQGRMEWGPRALGNRSILASATTEEMRDIINAKVKKREMFRPFAPVILEDKVSQYFEADDKLSPSVKWMLTVYPFKDIGKKEVPAVVHVDGTGRLESLNRDDNPIYYDLLHAYYKKTGIPIIINTSFNVRGEPIVCNPKNAIDCFLQTDIDYLVIGDFIVKK